jgi:hypothetical protein
MILSLLHLVKAELPDRRIESLGDQRVSCVMKQLQSKHLISALGCGAATPARDIGTAASRNPMPIFGPEHPRPLHLLDP